MNLHRATAEKARALRCKNVPDDSIIAQLGGRVSSSAEIDEQIEMLRAANRKYSKAYYSAVTWRVDCEPVKPDPEALADRDRRMAMSPSSITALLCGDPLPGMSALDRR